MYPRISDFFSDYLGFDLPFPIYSYGFMVAVAILTASWIAGREIKRLQEAGRLAPVVVTRRNGKKGKEKITLQPHELMGTITVLAAVGGIVGSKILYILETPGNVFDQLFSAGGLTFYGGLIGGGIAVIWYVRSRGLHLTTTMDAIAPVLILAYGIGRIGCHLAGDGDWGGLADLSMKPGWIPTWLWAETYPNNIQNLALPEPGVYPTPLYEFAVCTLLFFGLRAFRNHPFQPGWLFALYMVLNGAERFSIEFMRVNPRYQIFGLDLSQAQYIAIFLMIFGLIGLIMTRKRRETNEPEKAAADENGDEGAV